jgi:hypothetical protein
MVFMGGGSVHPIDAHSAYCGSIVRLLSRTGSLE